MKTHRLQALLGLLVLAAIAVGCSTNPVTGRSELILISEQQEIVIGSEAAPEFEQEFGGKVADESVQRYVQQVGQSVAAVSDRKMPYEYALLRSNVANAFALPGGKVYITAGLMSRMTNERQLAAVLGHETGHVAAKHNVQGLQRQMGAAVLVEIAARVAGADKQQAAESATKIVTSMVNLKYSRDDEYQADDVGMKYMAKAGYSPWGMVELLATLKEMNDSEPGSLGELFQTHPLTTKRIDRAREAVENNFKSWPKDAADPHAGQFLEMRSRLK